MTGLMFDAVTPANIPATATEIAGYVDGRYKWSATDWARFTLATVRWRITAIPFNYNADVCDCENGDYSPTQAAQWAKTVIGLGRRPIIYCNLDTWNQVQWALSLVGVSSGSVDWWIAHYTGVEHLEPGSIATQYADPGPYDLSETTFPPSTIPPPPEDDEIMRIFDTPGQPTLWWTGVKLVQVNAAGLTYVRDQLGVPYKELDASAYAFAVFSLTPTAPAPEHLTVTSTVAEAPA